MPMSTATRTITASVPTMASEHLRRGLFLMFTLGLANLLFGQGRLVDERTQAEGWYLSRFPTPPHPRSLTAESEKLNWVGAESEITFYF